MSCRNIYLDPIDRNKYFQFARSLFNEYGKEINEPCFDQIYDTYDGHTWFIQHLLNQLFQDTAKGKTAGIEMLEESTSTIIQAYERTYQDILNGFSDRQKELLIAISKEGKASELSSTAFISKYALTSVSSVQSAARTLLENETVTMENNYFYISNRFFSLWLKDRY